MPTQRAKIVEGGRLIVPAEYRRALGLENGSVVVVELGDGELRVRPLGSALRQVQARLRQFVPGGVSLADELIADRRAEAATEEAEERGREAGRRGGEPT